MIVVIQHIRTIAVLMTLFAHVLFGLSEPDQNYLFFTNNIGQFWGGVELFFVVSGYLITGILVRELLRSDCKTSNLKKFYIKRAARILPSAIFWASFILFFSYIYPDSKFGTPNDNIKHYIASIFFFENIYLTYDVDFRFSVYWSLAIEEQFYLFFPLLLLLLRKRIVLFLIVAYLFQALLDRPVSQSNLLFMVRYDALILGALIYFADHQGWLKKVGQKPLKTGFLSAILCFCLLGLIAAPVAFKHFYPVTFVDLFAALFVLISIVYAKQLCFTDSLISKISLWLADRSFTLYLSHKPCMFLMHLFAQKTGMDILPVQLFDLRWLITLAVILFSSQLCYTYIELPLRHKGRKLASQYTS